MTENKIILFFTDLHIPYQHKDCFKFLDCIKNSYKPDGIICGGDELDQHKISFHDKDPDIAFSPSSELDESIRFYRILSDIFPRLDILESNHGSLVYRRQKHHGLPRRVFKEWNEILEAPAGHRWHDKLFLKMSNGQELLVMHQRAKAYLKVSQGHGICYAQGHFHGSFGVQYWRVGRELKWGLAGGCLVDTRSKAMDYGRLNFEQPALGATIIINGIPILIPLIEDKKGNWKGSL